MWHAHTKHCRYCLAAHRNVQWAKRACLAAFGVAAAFLPPGTPRTAAVLVALSAAGALHKLGRLFHRYEFSHATND